MVSWYVSFSDLLLSMIISRSVYVAANGNISFFYTTEKYSIVYMHHILSIHSSADGHLGCFDGYCKQCCYETGMHASFQIKSFVWVYAQDWDSQMT